MSIAWTKLGQRSVQGTTSALTESAPSGNTGDGVDLNGVDAICVSVAGPSAFDGTGKWLFYRWSDYTREWRYLEGWDYDMTNETGKTSVSILLVPVHHKSGRLIAVPSGIGVSGGGTSLVITIEASFNGGANGQ